MPTRQARQTTSTQTYTAEQLRPLLNALIAAKEGDFSVRLPAKENGILSKIYLAFNDVISLNEGMAVEIVRVARTVGREGRMTERAALKYGQGSWGTSTQGINSLIEDLARPTTEVARVITAVAEGDLSQKMALEIEGTPVKGEFLRIGQTVNKMVDQLGSFAAEVTRVAREVGTEGKLGGQAEVKGVSGTWKDLTDNVNLLAGNLTNQVRNIALVTTAVANGDLSQKITVDARGEILELKDTVNTMVDQLNSFAAEVTRVAREVGTEGKLGGQAQVPGVSGTWKDLTDSVNNLAGNLTNQVRNIALVTTAVANGDLSQKITVDVKGEILELKVTINSMVDQLNSFAAEVTRVAREVGTEGKLGGQAEVKGVSGTWKDLTDNVNLLAGNLTVQLRDVSKVATAIANGDLTQTITVDVRGEILQIKNVINQMVDSLSTFAGEVTRVAREVGTEGKLGGQAEVKGVSGTWKDLTDNVNLLAGNLTNQVRNIALVTTAVANGDLSQKITVDARGEILELKDTINTMVDQLNSFAGEVTRVAREVGTEGMLGGQAQVKGVSGTWKDLTDNVNLMAINLTDQVRNIALVTTAVANGDLSQKITVDVKGEILELKNTINTMVDQLGSFAAEVTRVAREVGTEGKLGGQAEVRDVSGTWKDLTDNVNLLAGNLTNQVRNIALVTTAVANGDLSQKITVDARGEILELKETINIMVDQLNSFAAEVTRVAREVGSDGKLGGQAQVSGVSGTWRDLTDNVNLMAANLTNQVRNIALVTTAVANGDLSRKITVDVKGEILELKNTINTMVDQLNSFAAEVTRVAREVGTEGKLGGQAQVPGVSGTWKELTDNVNSMGSNLTTQVRGIVKVVTAVANGDLSQKLVVDAKGEVAALADTINSMIDTLSIFAEQVTTVAREVGTEGILGGQAKVPNVAGTWKDLTDNVNFMASNLTTQVREIAKVVTSVANGDLKRKLLVEAKGEISALADTINGMTDTLSIFADQVTTVAREVGTDGILGGQAKVPNVAGTWKDLTDNVNFMANSLTVQVRAISDVATAVTEGDLTRFITVEAQGEVSDLKNKINQMIANLKETTRQNTEQDWLKTNLARFGGMMQGQKSLDSVARLIMSELTPLITAHHGVFYIMEQSAEEPSLHLLSSYAFRQRKNVSNRFALGESLVGQCAMEKKSILLTRVPPDYIQINSGLGEAPPLNIIVLPVPFEGEIMAVIELASFQAFSEIHRTFLDQLMESVGVVLNMISANMRTEELLQQSQSLTQELQSQSQELQSQQDQLRKTNIELEAQAKELEEKATLLAEQNEKVEMKNQEVELARAALEEKAEQLAISSKYKSEFLANMSHELRTPLNSLLILAKLLADNAHGNLSDKQVEFAKTIHASGGDLLDLINEILDLSRVEAGKMELDVAVLPLADLTEHLDRTFEHVAQQKALDFTVTLDPSTPGFIVTDSQRLQQVLRNLLSNAFKFTERGSVQLTVAPADRDVILDNGELMTAGEMLAFSVKDTGIGIAKSKQNLIFEAFQQADGTTSRKFGGTGLGLSISKEITRLLGGRIRVQSELGKGSEFILYMPQRYQGVGADLGQKPDAAADSQEKQAGQTQGGEPNAPEHSEPAMMELKLLIAAPESTTTEEVVRVARNAGFKVIGAATGDEAVSSAKQSLPGAIVLDLDIVDPDGWSVLEQLEADEETRHIPIAFIASVEGELRPIGRVPRHIGNPVFMDEVSTMLTQYADSLDRQVKTVLIAGVNSEQRARIEDVFGSLSVEVITAGTARSALKVLKDNRADVFLLDLTSPDPGGLDLLAKIEQQAAYRNIPFATYAGEEVQGERLRELRRGTLEIVCRAQAPDSRNVTDETSLFLHRVLSKPLAQKAQHERQPKPLDLNRPARRMIPFTLVGNSGTLREEFSLKGMKVLVVDDDVRNIFALTGLLESVGAEVAFNESGKETISTLNENPDIDLVIMDIMMPEIDGYETARLIRNTSRFQRLPIIALTAKALSGDRERCLEAGMNDYITKPMDNEQLLRMIQKWANVRASN